MRSGMEADCVHAAGAVVVVAGTCLTSVVCCVAAGAASADLASDAAPDVAAGCAVVCWLAAPLSVLGAELYVPAVLGVGWPRVTAVLLAASSFAALRSSLLCSNFLNSPYNSQRAMNSVVRSRAASRTRSGISHLDARKP